KPLPFKYMGSNFCAGAFDSLGRRSLSFSNRTVPAETFGSDQHQFCEQNGQALGALSSSSDEFSAGSR
ncbi:hypothetical protein L9F63_003966, partial [Diploptera punctata]